MSQFVNHVNKNQTYIASMYYLPLYFQAVGGASALGSGLLVLPVTLTQTFTGVLSGVLVRVTGKISFLRCSGTLLTVACR